MINSVNIKLAGQFRQYSDTILASMKIIKQDIAEKTIKFNSLLSDKADQSQLIEISKSIASKIGSNNTQFEQAERSKTFLTII